jgi:succinoglycan biosynthesis transport protein ExoP
MGLEHGQSDRSSRLSAGGTAAAGSLPTGKSLGTGAGGGQFVRLNFVRALKLHRRFVLGTALAGLILALIFVEMTWPVYTAVSQIYVQPVQTKLLPQGNEQAGPMNPAAYDSYLQQQVQNAKNSDVLINTLRKLGPGVWQRSDEGEQAAADRLGRSIEIARVGMGYEIAIRARANDPGLAARIANVVASTVVERAAGQGNAGDAQRIEVLREERDRIQNALEADYAEQDELNKQLGVAAVGTEASNSIDDQIAKARGELIQAQTDHDRVERRLTAMKVGQGDSSVAISAEVNDLVAADPDLTRMKRRRAALITQMASLTPDNPAYRKDAEELAKINGALDFMMNDLRTNAINRIEEKLRTDLERTSNLEAKLNEQLRQLAQTETGATPKLQRVNDVAADVVRLRSRYSAVDDRLDNYLIEDRAPGWVHLSLVAIPPRHPTISGVLEGALLLALGGLILGVVVAVVINKLDSRVYIAADVERVLGSAPMAVLPDFNEVSEGVAQEHVLRLSAAMEHASKQGGVRNCVFTGAAPETGVTTLARRVRETLATIGTPTVLLDASGGPGLAGRDSGEMRSHHSPVEPATKSGDRSTVLLKEVGAQATHQDGLVLTDTAPLTISAETERLARSADCTIVVIESGATTRAQLVATARTLQRIEAGAVGIVLNRVRLAKADPAFRGSIQDIDRHVRAYGISSSLRPEPSGQIADGLAPVTNLTLSETHVRKETEPVAPERAPESAPRRLQLNASDWGEVTPALASLTRRKEGKGTPVPWWQPKEPMQLAAEVSPPAEVDEVDQAAAMSPVGQAPPLPAWFWEGAPRGSGGYKSIAPAEEEKPVESENPFEAESRLNGLRGLILTLGLKNMSKRRGWAQLDKETSLPDASEGEPSLASGTISQPAETGEASTALAAAAEASAPTSQTASEVANQVANQVATEVTAQPEFLPPKESVPLSETKGARKVRDDDEIQILPAKRGQYKSNV